MRIAAVTLDYPPHRWIGSEIATHEMLLALAARGHDVRVVAWRVPYGEWEHDGIPVRTGGDAVREELASADVAICHAELGARLRRFTGPKIGITHNARPPTASACREWPWALLAHNSHTAAAQLAPMHTAPHIVVHPPVDWRRWQVDRSGADAITLVNVTGEKGSDTFYELARRRPDRRWLGVIGGWGEPDIRSMPGVEIVPHGVDMRSVYSRTRILLMPSEHESWGRVAVEAMSSGIPVIATDLPGPREAIGAGGVMVELDWWDRYEQVLEELDDPARYAALSTAATARARELDPIPELDQFVTAVEALA